MGGAGQCPGLAVVCKPASGHRPGAERQAETLQNFSCRIGRMNCGKNFHRAAAATFTLKNVHQKGTVFILHLPQWN